MDGVDGIEIGSRKNRDQNDGRLSLDGRGRNEGLFFPLHVLAVCASRAATLYIVGGRRYRFRTAGIFHGLEREWLDFGRAAGVIVRCDGNGLSMALLATHGARARHAEGGRQHGGE